MSALELGASALLTLLVHATALLGLVWLAEKAKLLRHPGWAELAWRAALLGALVSTSVQTVSWLRSAAAPATAGAAAEARRLAHPYPLPASRPSAANAGDRSARPSATATVVDAAQAPSRTANVQPSPANGQESGLSGAAPALALRLPDPLVIGALLAWLALVARAGWRLLRQAQALRRLAAAVAAHATPAPTPLPAEAAALAAGMALPVPPLRVLAGLASPMLLPDATLLLPDWVAGLSTAQRRALLAHEFAHLQRRDPLWRLAIRIAALPLAAHPLAGVALARLDALAEDACDARAARVLGDGRPLAECLAACLSRADRRVGTPALAVAMAGEPGAVVRRVTNLLKESPMSDRSLSPALRRGAIVLAIAAAIALPGLAITTVGSDALAGVFGDSLSVGTELFSGGNRQSYRETTDDGSVLLRIDGAVTFTADESDVAALEPGSSLTVRIAEDGVVHYLKVTRDGDALVRLYKVDGEERPFAAEGRAWFGRTLPTLLRRTGLDADARSQRILAAGGVPALLAEIRLVDRDYARRVYLAALFEHARLEPAQLQQAIALAGDIDSDFERRQALQAALDTQRLDDASLARLLEVGAGIGSSFELAELLVTAVGTQRFAPATIPAWQKALAAVDSDFERGRVLQALLAEGGTDVVPLALASAGEISSDFELRQVLEHAAPLVGTDAAARRAWLQAAARVGSDFERRTALVELLEAGDVDADLAGGVLAAAADIGSDFEKRTVLQALAAKMPADPALISRYRAVARDMGDFERGQAEKALDRFAML